MFKNGTICVTNIQITKQNLPGAREAPLLLLPFMAAQAHRADFRCRSLALRLLILCVNGTLQEVLLGVAFLSTTSASEIRPSCCLPLRVLLLIVMQCAMAGIHHHLFFLFPCRWHLGSFQIRAIKYSAKKPLFNI